VSETGLALPPAGGVSDQTVAFAAELTDRSGKAPVIEAALAHATGRPRPLPVRAVLTALLCLALDDRPLFLTEATGLLFCELSGASRALLGVPGAAAATGRSWPPTAESATASTGSATRQIPRRCRRTAAWPRRTSGPAAGRCSQARPKPPGTGWNHWSTH
jgi:hypothetical protein